MRFLRKSIHMVSDGRTSNEKIVAEGRFGKEETLN